MLRLVAGILQVGMVAINDGILLESCIFRILQRHFREQPCYVQLMELFHEVIPPAHPASFPGTWQCWRTDYAFITNADAVQRTHGGCQLILQVRIFKQLHLCMIPPVSIRRCACLTHDVCCGMQTTYQTSHGQLLDLITAPIGTVRRLMNPEKLAKGGSPV